ncbi:hypothetical protein KSF78_0000891 [Schistosoma japonicum]|nr:hypothetical protein KSF78_0000891 [Schistosoma japonicum]
MSKKDKHWLCLRDVGSEILDKYCGILSEKHNITRNPTKKYSSNKEKLLVENEADNKNETFSANIRPPEPVGCQLLQMNSAPGYFKYTSRSLGSDSLCHRMTSDK